MDTRQIQISAELYDATANGDLDRMRDALDRGANPGYVDHSCNGHYTPLHRAAETANRPAAEMLLAAGAPLDAMDEFGRTPLEIAVQFGKDENFSIWLVQKCGSTAGRSRKALAMAAECGQERLMDVLIVLGCRDGVGTTGANALISAAWAGSVIGVRKMLALGADINSVDKTRYTALHLAAERGEEEVVEVLLAAGANPDLVQVAGYAPLHCSAGRDSAGICRRLVEAGADATIRNGYGQTPFQHAIERGAVRVMEQLRVMGFGESMDQEELNRNLAESAKRGHAAMVIKFLDMGANPNYKPDGKTLLQYAKSGAADVKQAILAARSSNAIRNAVQDNSTDSEPVRRAPRISPM